MLRPARPADRAAVVALMLAEETAWYGVAEVDEDEASEFLEFYGPIEAGAVAGDPVRGYAATSSTGEILLVADPVEPVPVLDALVPWAVEHGGGELEVPESDHVRTAWLEANGWRHVRSAFDLLRPGAGPVEDPRWPPDVGVTAYSAERDEDAVHQMVYVEAGWGDVPGHHVRSLESWRNIVAPPARGWVARHEGRPVGWVSSRLFADGRGWVSQLAVAEDHRRAGLGRALLLHAFGDLLEAGATALALGVAAENASALGLYRSVGLEIWRESRTYLLEVAGV